MKNARKHTPASQRWLARQLNDPYVQAAKSQGWRSRAAFKLLELDDKYTLIGKNARIVDLGAAPGGWSQVALARGAAKIVGIDLLPIPPVAGAEFIEGDFTEEGMEARLTELLGGQADLVLSDMAPNTTGHVATDHIRIMALAEMALAFAILILVPGGAFVAKLFQGGAEHDMLTLLKKTSAPSVTPNRQPAARTVKRCTSSPPAFGGRQGKGFHPSTPPGPEAPDPHNYGLGGERAVQALDGTALERPLSSQPAVKGSGA